MTEYKDGLAYDLHQALDMAVKQLKMAGDCIEKGLYDEALMHTRSMPREKREALERYKAHVNSL